MFYIKDTSGSDNTVVIKKTHKDAPARVFEYSTDNKNTWVSIQTSVDGESFTIPANGTVYIKADNCPNAKYVLYNNEQDYYYHNVIYAEKPHIIGGDISSLAGGEDLQDISDLKFPFYGLFENDSTLESSEDLILPATKLCTYAYSHLFSYCINMTSTVKSLNADVLTAYCYENMYYCCKSLEKAPDIMATKLPFMQFDALARMFYNCKKINSVKCMINSAYVQYKFWYAENWLNGVNLDGVFYKNEKMSYWPIDVNGIPYFWKIKNGEEPEPELKTAFYFENKSAVDIDINVIKNGSPSVSWQLSNDGISWTAFSGEKINVPANSKTYIKGVYNTTNSGNYITFSCEKDVYCGGNIMSLCYDDDFESKTKITEDYQFYKLFSGMSNLMSAPELPATELSKYCYAYMFSGCTNLVTTAEQIESIKNTKAEINKDGDLVFTYDFRNINFNLNEDGELIIETIPEGIISAELGDQSNEKNILYISYEQDKIGISPELPATILVEGCYSNMFNGCSKLSYIKCLATDISATNCTNNWLYGVNNNGVFIKSEGVDWVNRIPEGWTTKIYK